MGGHLRARRRPDAASTPTQVGTLIGVALVFGLVNLVLKPLVKVAGCVLYVLTFGLIGFVVNALLFWFASWMSGELGLPFHVSGFWAAFFGAIVVAVVGVRADHAAAPAGASRKVVARASR